MPGAVLGAWDTAVNKTDKTPNIPGVYRSECLVMLQGGWAPEAIPVPLGSRHCWAPAVSPQQIEGTCNCRQLLATTVESQERCPGCGAQTPWAGKLRPDPSTEGRCQIEQSVHLWTWLGWVGTGLDRGSDAPPRQASPRRALERYFHAVVTAVEQMASEPSPSREGHLRRLEEIYRSLLGPAVASRGRCSGKRPTDRRGQRGPSQRRGRRSGDPEGRVRK